MKLYIIGNGFDKNHGCETGYDSFKVYLTKHSYSICGFELSHYFTGLDKKQWTDFENELENIDFESEMADYISDINPNDSDREFEDAVSRNSSIQESFEEALDSFHPALCQALSDFVCEATSEKIDTKDYFTGIFKPDDVFVTFNYTKLLETIYRISDRNINHIHGIAHRTYRHKDDVGEFYGDPTIIFGHGNLKKTPKIQRNYEYDPFKPQKCLRTLNQELKKDYQIKSLDDFISRQSNLIDTVEIIGHNLGEVDEPYFKELNKLIPKSAEIVFWVYDCDTEEEKLECLRKLFPKHKIVTKYYPD